MLMRDSVARLCMLKTTVSTLKWVHSLDAPLCKHGFLPLLKHDILLGKGGNLGERSLLGHKGWGVVGTDAVQGS